MDRKTTLEDIDRRIRVSRDQVQNQLDLIGGSASAEEAQAAWKEIIAIRELISKLTIYRREITRTLARTTGKPTARS